MKIKKATKLLALAISAIMLVSIVPMVASAAAELSIGTITMDTSETGILSFTVPYTASSEVEQVTVLAVVGSGDTAPATADNTNIAYIDQQASEGNPSFTFKVATDRFNTTNNKLFIKIGGTAIDSAKEGVPQEIGTTVTFTITGIVTPISNINDAAEDAKIQVTATLKDSSGNTVATKIANTADGVYQFDAVAAGEYTVEFTRAGALKKNPLLVNTANAVNSIVDLGITALYNFDINMDGYIDETDAYAIVSFYDTYPGDGIYDPIYDTNLDGYVDETDAYGVVPFYDFFDNID